MRRRIALLATFYLLGATSPAAAGPSPSGSIPCIWNFFVVLSSVQQACLIPADEEMTQALRQSIADLEDYIVKHSSNPDMRAVIESEKKAILDGQKNFVAAGNACEGSADYALYQDVITNNTPETILAEVTAALSAPRQDPFEGGCF
jgi:hypothetical protein